MPLWGRHEITALILRQWHYQILRLRGRVDVHLICVGSEGARSSALVSGYADTMSYVEAPNDPLNRKWNKGIEVSRARNPDAVMIVGSDDLVSDSLHLTYAAKVQSGLKFFGLKDLYFLDAPTQRLGYWPGYGPQGQPQRAGEPVGLARCHSRALLDAVGWRLWPNDPARNTVLDLMSLQHLGAHGFTPTVFRMAELGAKAVDIKIGTGITGFDRIPYTRKQQGREAMAYLADLVDESGLQQLATQWRAVAA
jgi:hypothetical protein